MKVEKVDHIHVYVSDMEKAMAFWSAFLGTKFSPPSVEQEWKFTAATEPLGIELIAPTSPDGVVAKSIARRGEGVAAISFKVPDIEKATAELEAQGLKVVGKMKHGGLKEVQFHPKDSFGVMIELAEYEEEHGIITAIQKG